METLLNQALQLTVIGMGMTFAAIGLLVLGMYLMTLLLKEKKVVEEDRSESMLENTAEFESPEVNATDEDRVLAAVAAVSIALAQTASVSARSDTESPVGGWRAYIRGQNLSRRQRYDLLRTRR